MHLLCWNRVREFDRWMAVFASHKEAHRQAGLFLQGLWVQEDDPAVVHYVFEVRDRERAQAFISAPDAAGAAEKAGVTAGECHFVDGREGY